MFSSVTPGGLLGEFVASLWLHERQGRGQGADLRLPTGTVEFVVNLSADYFWLPDGVGVRQAYPGAVVVVPGHGTISGDPMAHTLKLLAA